MSDVPSKTVVRTGRCNEEGMEEAEVHWPVKGKGKGGMKIWYCVLLPEAGKMEQEDIGLKPAKRHYTAAGKQQLRRIVTCEELLKLAS